MWNMNYEVQTYGRNQSWFILNYYLISYLQGLAKPSDMKAEFARGVRTTKIPNTKLESQPTTTPNFMSPVEELENYWQFCHTN